MSSPLTAAGRCGLLRPPFQLYRVRALRGSAFEWLGVAALIGGLAYGSNAAAEQLVKFVAAGQGDPIQGYLTRPKGAGPFPAIVLLHTCLGLPKDRGSMGERIAGFGYVALFVDDFTTRGLKETCAVDFNEATADAYGALAYLSRLPDVDGKRIAAVGFSQGGDTALKIASQPMASAGVGEPAFKAAAAFYPPCANQRDAKLEIPTLILIGAEDGVTPAADCVRLATRQTADAVKLAVYPGAEHGFDNPEFGAGSPVLGMRLAYNRKAAQRSWAELRDFLARRLAR
jgi:dienelactone hydrolase